jgi:hypothetical protein
VLGHSTVQRVVAANGEWTWSRAFRVIWLSHMLPQTREASGWLQVACHSLRRAHEGCINVLRNESSRRRIRPT